MQLDSATSALIGAIVGGVIGVVGTAITAWTAARRERASFERAHSQQHVDRVRDAYDFALNVLFNTHRRTGNPDYATFGAVFARVSLHGSPEVKRIVDAYLNGGRERTIDLEELCEAMRAHLSEIESARPTA